MCGIAGFLDSRGFADAEIAAAQVRQMSDAIAHRGPDDSGEWIDPAAGVALGHRRLSIIDLSPLGRQPMLSAHERYVISYNGEVYNFRELRRELETLGHRFHGGSDTEVMLAACVAWGPERAVEKFHGMFAFALWDRQTRTLRLVRDRMGVKPLYWTLRDGILLFGSELKALMAHPAWRGEVDREAAAGYLRYSYIASTTSIFRGVHKLAAGKILAIQPGGEPRIEPYWRLRDVAVRGQAAPIRDEAEALEQLEIVLREAVQGRLISDVPLGVFLSGGIDSSTVAALMQQNSMRKVRTFSIGFDDDSYNEAQHARAVAAHLGTDHTEMYVTAQDALDVIPRLPQIFDEPFADPSQIPTVLLCALTRRHVTVALSGDGGDELFAGYPRYRFVTQIWNRMSRAPRILRQSLAAAIGMIPEPLLDRVGLLAPRSIRSASFGRRVQRAAGLLGSASSDAFYGDLMAVFAHERKLMTAGSRAGAFAPDPDLPGSVPDFAARMQYYDALNYLPDDIMVKVDRCSMAVGLEAREPLLDHRVVEFAWRLPPAFNIGGGQSKRLLRKVLFRHVPSTLVDRPKMGFSIPLAGWLRGPLRDWAETMLSPAKLRAGEMFNVNEVRSLWDDHQSGRNNREAVLWNLLMFQAWKDHYRVA